MLVNLRSGCLNDKVLAGSGRDGNSMQVCALPAFARPGKVMTFERRSLLSELEISRRLFKELCFDCNLLDLAVV